MIVHGTQKYLTHKMDNMSVWLAYVLKSFRRRREIISNKYDLDLKQNLII